MGHALKINCLLIKSLNSIGVKLRGGSNTIQSLAVGMGMNTHGTLEIILGTLALQAGLISEEVFVAILVTVVVTILISAPLVKYCIERDAKSGFLDVILRRKN